MAYKQILEHTLKNSVREDTWRDINHKLEELNSRGILVSGIAIREYVSIALASSKRNVAKALEEYSLVHPSKKEWLDTKALVLNSINELWDSIHNRAKSLWRDDMSHLVEQALEGLESELINYVDLYIEGKIKELEKGVKERLWDLFKILIGFFLGYLVNKLHG